MYTICTFNYTLFF